MQFHTSAIIGLLAASVAAIPVATPTSLDQTATDASLMTVASCQAHLDHAGATKTLFWSGVAKQATAAQKDTKDCPYLAGYKVMRQLFTPSNFQSTYQAQFSKESEADQTKADDAFWNACSEALANLASGTAYVMLPEGTGLDWGSRAKSHWAEHEWPIICKGSAVKELYRLSSTDTKVKENITSQMLALRSAGKCPSLVSVNVEIGGESAT